MIRIFEALLLAFAATALAETPPPQEPVQTAEVYDVTDLVLTGLERTSAAWLEGYIDYRLPAQLTRRDGVALARKLMTTGVFTDVKVVFEQSQVAPPLYRLHVQVEERWTTIPVVRGVYGGGTPLRILGLYDTHSFGRLVTLGGELRKYGDAPPGFVVYARDPRSQAGRYYLGAEFWRDFRRRQLYDREGEPLGALSSNASISRLRMLTPLAFESDADRDFRWKYGFDLEVIQEAPSVFDPEDAAPSAAPPDDVGLPEMKRRQYRILPTLLYDDIDLSIVEYDGFRLKLKSGPTFGDAKPYGSTELDLYGYKLMRSGLNVASHAVIGQTSFTSLQNQYFLGGLDSIRGLPDGAIYGTHAAYGSLEVRQLSYKSKYLWIQSVAFGDTGAAGETWDVAADDVRSTAGLGVRFAVPQIYRMIFRFDYAWALDGSGVQGITAGMNQFFDPYTPL